MSLIYNPTGYSVLLLFILNCKSLALVCVCVGVNMWHVCTHTHIPNPKLNNNNRVNICKETYWDTGENHGS